VNVLNACSAVLCSALLCVPLWVAAQTVTSFTVVNADTGADIATFTSSGTVSIAATPRINVRANASAVKSVVFSGTAGGKTESAAPYAYKGDSAGVYSKWAPTAGTYVINAKPFSGSGGSGTAGAVATLTLTITGTPVPDPVQQPPKVNAGSDQSVALPNSTVTLVGSASDADGSVVSTAWSQVSGPNTASLGTASGTTLTVGGLIVGSYTFRLTAKDNQGNVAFDEARVSVSPQASDQGQVFTLSYKAAPADNPLKGFMPYQGSYAFAHSMEWFYLPLKDLQTGFDTFNWSALDARLDAIAARGHQAVFRVYLDYPNTEYGVPGFLSGVPKRSYSYSGNGSKATSYSPDYSNADLQRAVLSFIAALGARYDNDPRVGFITAGLLGFWGEWHTYPQNSWMATPDFMNQVLDAYERAFPHKLILAREPKTGVAMDRPRLGFHDDSFAYQTLPPTDWHFWPRITAAGLQNSWKARPIGGEVRPEVQGCMWNDTPCTPAGQGFDLSVTTTHASWMLNHGTVAGALSATQLQRAIAGAQSLGYSLHVPKATLDPLGTLQALHGTVSVDNRGVAPFYYPWTVQMAALDAAGNLKTWSMNWDLRTALPGSPVSWTFYVPNHGLAAGTYTLLMGVANPMTGGRALKFANATQDQHRSGWLSLGSFVVDP